MNPPNTDPYYTLSAFVEAVQDMEDARLIPEGYNFRLLQAKREARAFFLANNRTIDGAPNKPE
jgi:hypothetical protein